MIWTVSKSQKLENSSKRFLSGLKYYKHLNKDKFHCLYQLEKTIFYIIEATNTLGDKPQTSRQAIVACIYRDIKGQSRHWPCI